MSAFTLYGIPGSPYLQAVLLCLEEKGLAYHLVRLAPFDLKSPDHLARHPFGRIPVLDHGDFRLYETQAILRYLDRLHPVPLFTPADPRLEARMNQIAGIADWYAMPTICAGIAFPRLVAPHFGLPVDEAKVTENLPRAARCVDEFGRLLGAQPFMAGEALSIADLIVAPQLAFFARTAESRPMFEGNPGLAAWLARMEERPSMQATMWEPLRGPRAA